jgi:DNA-binding NarL/FixJ family response regulator
MSMSKRRCLLVGYSGMTLFGLRSLLGRDFEVLAVEPEVRAALDAVMRFHPEAAVIGLEPAAGGLEMAQLLREACPELAFTYLTSDSDTDRSETAAVSKTRPVAGWLASEFKLTACQHEVLSRLVRGLSMKEVARELNISPRTVAFHKYRAMKANGLR